MFGSGLVIRFFLMCWLIVSAVLWAFNRKTLLWWELPVFKWWLISSGVFWAAFFAFNMYLGYYTYRLTGQWPKIW